MWPGNGPGRTTRLAGVIAHLWFTHHRLFENVKQYSSLLVFLNMAWLLTIVILPFPTELVGRPGQDHFTQFFYIGTIAVSSVLLTAITLLVHGSPELAVEARGLSRPVVLRALVPTAVLLLALVLSPLISYWGLLLLLVSPVVQRIR
ncbi:TMEM175 family protein [Lentzea sp. NPDC054927]